MNKKRTLLTVVAMVLVCVLSIMGTVAYLKDNTATVTNTFVAAGGGKLIDPDNGAFTLKEHKAVKIMKNVTVDGETKEIWTGEYDLNEEWATTEEVDGEIIMGNEYEIMPGMDIPKDPVVTITGKTDSPAYLYIEVINNLTFSTMVENTEGEMEDSLVIDPEHWIQIKDKDTDGRDIYVYTIDDVDDPNRTAAIITEDVTANIIESDQFTVNKDVDPADPELVDQSLTFKAFLAQAYIGGEETDAEAIFDACFATTTP